MPNSKVVYEGWMVRYGRRKIGRSFIHMRYFVLESRLLAYYKKKPQDSVVPIKTLLIDGNCRVEDRGLKTHHGHMIYVLSVYNKKEKYQRMTMAAFNIQEALVWKEKIESVIDQVLLNLFSTGQRNLIQTCLTRILIIRRFLESIGAFFSAKMPKSCSRAMKAVGVVEATCEEIFELVMSMDAARCEWDCSFQYGSLVEEVDGHTAVLYHKLQLDWFPMFVWPRDLCYVRYWRRNDDGSYGGGFNISPMKPRDGRPRTQVQHLMQIDLKGWGVGYISSFQHHCLLQMLNSVAGLREYFSQTDERTAASRIPVMINMTSISNFSKRSQKLQPSSVHHHSHTLDQIHEANGNGVLMDEYSDEDEDFQCADQEQFSVHIEASEEEPQDQVDVSIFSGNLRRDDHDNARDCWTLSDGNNFRVRSKNFCNDKSKVLNCCLSRADTQRLHFRQPEFARLNLTIFIIFLKTPAGKHLMDLVAVDWLKDTKRMDHVARRSGCAAQVPGSTHYSMVFYFVAKELGSLLQRFVDGDDDFRNSRLKLIPSVPKGSWIVRQSVGSTPCLLGKAVDCNYIRGPNYLEVDVDIGSSTVANGVLGLVIGVITTLVVDMAFLVQANTTEELPERLIGAVRISHLELSSAIESMLDSDPSDSVK
ncbi:hypothetical protein DH2020_036315 [Rehmannia glutinosa]|uniref:Protein ENHANCED DISEASE RESISTANCE 2-like n=1 Tax=Rehmannia glutinosa TaxID=99300 RepID=A0ABR0V4T4_REHGL